MMSVLCKKLSLVLFPLTLWDISMLYVCQSLPCSWTDHAISHACVFAQATGRSLYPTPLNWNVISLVNNSPHFHLQKTVKFYFISALALYIKFYYRVHLIFISAFMSNYSLKLCTYQESIVFISVLSSSTMSVIMLLQNHIWWSKR